MDRYKEEQVYKQPEVQRFLRKAENIGMTKREKAYLWSSLSKKMEKGLSKESIGFTSPITLKDIKQFQEKALEYVPEVPQSIKSKFTWNIFVYASKQTVAASVVGAVLLASFGTAFAADDSLPGEALYNVKINITENVQSFVTVGNSAQANLAVTLAKKRLEEAESLSAKGQLNAETQTIIEDNFKKHTRTIKEKVIELKKENNDDAVEDVVTNLASGINAHETILTSIKEKTSEETGSHIDSLLESVNDNVQENLAEIITVDASSTPNIDPAISATSTPEGTDTDADTVEATSTKNDKTPATSSAEASAKAELKSVEAKKLMISEATAASTTATTSLADADTRLSQKVDATLITTGTVANPLSEKDISELQQDVNDDQKQALETIAKTKNAISEATGSNDSLLNSEAQSKLNQAEKMAAKGDALFKKGDITKALAAYAQARSLATEAQVFIDVHTDATEEVKNLLKK